MNKQKKITDKAQDALNRLSKGESTINKIRSEFGLKPLEDESADELFIAKE